MKKFLVLFVAVLGLVALVGAVQAGQPTEELQAEVSGVFQGTPQYNSLEVLNAGTITLTMRLNGVSWGDLDGGQMSVQMDDGRKFKIQNMWTSTGNPGEYRWVQYLPGYVSWLWIENPQATVIWREVGPFKPHPSGYGIVSNCPVTQINLSIDLLSHTGRTWQWRLSAEPMWAADQWPWWDQVETTVFTKCPGNLVWRGTAPVAVFYTTLPPGWVGVESELAWQVQHPGGGWSQIGPTWGPECNPPRIFLPLVNTNK